MTRLNYSDPKSRAKKPIERDKALGQVFTPKDIAAEMVSKLLAGREEGPIRLIDPCVGPCTFPREMVRHKLITKKDILVAVDLDDQMVAVTKAHLENENMAVTYRNEDYLSLRLDNCFDYAILNPPYIRQEWIENKDLYREQFKSAYDVEIPGTSNLYAYFLVKVLKDLKPGGRFSCIIYDSWQFTIFGQWLIKHINSECSELSFKPVVNQPFEGRIIDATIIYGTKKQEPIHPSAMEIDSFARNGYVAGIKGFSTIDKLFFTKRGLRLKQANFFMCTREEGTIVGATPFVKKVSSVKGFMVSPDHPEAALLIRRGETNLLVMKMLQDRIKLAKKNPDNNISILTWHQERPGNWHSHTPPPAAPLIFNYYMRKRPKHILNDRCYSDNFYGLIPHKGSVLTWLAILNSTAVCVETLSLARTQGSGLSKIQLFEYRQVSVPNLASFSKADTELLEGLGRDLISTQGQGGDVLSAIDDLIFRVFPDARLNPKALTEVMQTFQP